MAAFHGKRGVADFTGLTFEMVSFTVNATADVAECTVMNAAAVAAATHWKDFMAGYKDWTATAEVIEPTGGAGLSALGTEAALSLDATDGPDYAGNAICTGYSPVVDSGDVGRCTLTFQGIAQLTAA